jgi:Tfp pilus assembly major pilin PilA
MDLPAYAGQAALTSGFWMSFHELTNGYPWLTKRTVRVLDPAAPVPRRSAFAWLLALFVPYTGRAGRGVGGLIVIAAIIGILAAVAIPAFKDYEARAALASAHAGSEPVRQALDNWYQQHDREAPGSLQEAGLPDTLPTAAGSASIPRRWSSRSRRGTASWCSCRRTSRTRP